jgi:chemotaxis signal transduction protein
MYLSSFAVHRADLGKHNLGIMVDAVSEVLEIPGSDIEPPPSFGARIRADFILGHGQVRHPLGHPERAVCR